MTVLCLTALMVLMVMCVFVHTFCSIYQLNTRVNRLEMQIMVLKTKILNGVNKLGKRRTEIIFVFKFAKGQIMNQSEG